MRVKNVFAGTLAIGTLVYVNGTTTDPATGDDVYATITKADADGAAPANRAMYVVTEAMTQNSYGKVARFFVHRGVDTSGFTTVGDPAYLSATAGETTATATPQRVGFCAKKSASAGILVYNLRDTPVTNGASVSAIAAARTITAAESGGVFTVAKTSAYAITLPTPQQGLRFKFMVLDAGANAVTISDGSAHLKGVVSVNNTNTAMTGTTITLASAGSVGDWVAFEGIDATTYLVTGACIAAAKITVA